MTDHRFLRVAAVSMKHTESAVGANLERHLKWLERAASAEARIVCFPEFALTGWVHQRKEALTLTSAPIQQLKAWASRHDTFIATGFIEKRAGNLFNTAILIGPQGQYGTMRKVNLVRQEAAYYRPGRDFPVFDLGYCSVGIAICADATRFETLHILSLRGAEVILAPHANTLHPYGHNAQGWLDWRLERWPLFARDACVYIVGVNNAGSFECGDGEDQEARWCGGGAIIDYKGQVVASPPPGVANRECMMLADLDIQAVREAREGSELLSEFRPCIVYNRRSGWKHGKC
ncbi:MAG: carbon-nitrogen hydrolase family protein [Chloroflexi bacterium]|nr:carbon-nitrogen hydrolase family protein [Chloroflexota bacterium]